MTILRWQAKILLKVISFPLIVTLSSLIPNLSSEFLFCHGGLGWLLLSLSFPWALGIIIIYIRKQLDINIRKRIVWGIIFLIFYLIFIIPMAFILKKEIISLGIVMNLKEVLEFYIFPISLLFHI